MRKGYHLTTLEEATLIYSVKQNYFEVAGHSSNL